MFEVVLDGISKNIDEVTIQTWFFEEGDPVTEGEDLIEISTEEGTLTIPSPKTGVLAEVYYDEGETVARGEILCTIDDEDEIADDDDEEDDEDKEDEDEEEVEDEDELEDEEDEENEDEDEK